MLIKSHGIGFSARVEDLTPVFGKPGGALTWEIETLSPKTFWIMPCPGQDLDDPVLDFDLVSDDPATSLEALELVTELLDF